jgi:hypothetical protein
MYEISYIGQKRKAEFRRMAEASVINIWRPVLEPTNHFLRTGYPITVLNYMLA